MKKIVEEKESKRVFKCLERDVLSRRDMQQIVTTGGGKSSNCPSRAMTSKKIVLSGLLAFFVGIAVCFSALFSFGVLPKISYAENIGYWTDEGNYATSFAEGDGSKENPYKISTAGELARLAYLANDTTITEADYITTEGTTNYYFDNTYFVQTADIDLAGHYWKPIAYEAKENPSRHFSGNYDGGNFKISNLTLYYDENTSSGNNYQGLFCIIEGHSNIATIQNINLENFVADSNDYVGCVSYCSINTYFYNCNVLANISEVRKFGGIVYVSDSSYVYNCSLTGDVSCLNTNARAIGGIVQQISNGEIKNCVNYADFNCIQTESGGGIVGNSTFTPISNCVNYGNLNFGTGMTVAGICGMIQQANITNCVNVGNITGTLMIAGIASAVVIGDSGALVSNSYNLGKIESWGLYGGLIACLGMNLSSSSSSASAKLINSYNLGELVYNEKLDISEPGWDAFIGVCGGIVACVSDLYDGEEVILPVNGELINGYYGGNCTQIGGVAGQDTENAVYLDSIATDAQTQAWYEDSKWNADYPWDFENQWQFVEGENNGYPLPRTDSKIYFDYWDDNKEYYSSTFVGAGTQDNPYLISSAADLAGMAKLVNSGDEHFASAYYLQTSNINLSDHFWRPIGDVVIDSSLTDITTTNAFSGVYDGDGYIISGLRYNNSFEGANFALFNAVESKTDSTALLKNITISGEINSSKETNVAGLVIGAKNAEILNCVNKVNITTQGMAAGVVYFTIDSYLSNLFNYGSITCSDLGAGCVGYCLNYEQIKYSELSCFYNYGTVNVTGTNGGLSIGVCGYLFLQGELYFVIDDFVNFGNITINDVGGPDPCFAAALFGGVGNLSSVTGGSTEISAGQLTIKNCYNIGKIQANNSMSAILISNLTGYDVKCENCYNLGNVIVSSSSYNMGLFGQVMITNEFYLKGCYNANMAAGWGLGFYIYAETLIVEDCFAVREDGTYSTKNGAGLFYNISATSTRFSNTYFYGYVYGCRLTFGSSTMTMGGGAFVDSISGDALFENCSFIGHVECVNNSYTGAMISSASGNATFVNCKFAGTVSGTGIVGGFVGSGKSVDFQNCTALGNVSGTTNIGGFVGQSQGSVSISHSMFEGNLYLNSTSSSTYVGGFVGNATNCTGFSVANSLVNANIFIGSTGAYASGVVGNITLTTTSETVVIDKCAILSNISCSSGGTLTNSKPFFYSTNVVDTDIITNTYGVYNSALSISSVTNDMDGAFGYLDNFQGGLPLPLGFYYLTSYANTSGIVEQLQLLSFN